MNEKRYYWLKLEETYFDLKVQKALRKLPSGAEMLICYLKMQLKYLSKNGLIEYQGIYKDISEEIALDIDEDENLVKATLEILKKWNVIEDANSFDLYLTEMQERIGTKTDSAIRVAKHREKQKLLQCNTDVTKCNYIRERDRERERKEIDIELEQEQDKCNSNTIYDFIENNFNRGLTPIEYEQINLWEDNELTRYAIKQAVLNGKFNIKYIDSILQRYKFENITSVQQAQENLNQFKQKQNEPRLSWQEEKEKREQEVMQNFFKELEMEKQNGFNTNN